MEFTISSGKWGRTPTGVFTIAYKTRAQKMEGGSQALGTYYYLPNVQFVQFFGNSEIPWSRGFSFHGTYWHNNFGTPMSHGCINMTNEDAEKLYYWTTPSVGDKRVIKATEESPGTKVIIFGTAPNS
jgi:lipoprotein-anchoring transpeptidase ErfK/SrfK